MNISSTFKINKWLILQIVAFICIALAFRFLVIKDFSGPLAGITGIGPWPHINHDPVDVYEYPGFYLSKNLNFKPYPQLDILNNQTSYPYGIKSVFLAWIIEGDIFYAILYSFFGVGPWLQAYYFLTVLITAVGTFALLYRDYGFARATGSGFLTSFCNFYAIYKYPHHFNLSVVHWTTLSLIADFLIVKRVALNQHVSLRLILVRFCLLILTFGQDLGYVAGFSLTSFSVSILFIAVLLCYRYFRGGFRLIELLHREIEAYRNDFFSSPRTCLALLGLSSIAGYMYLPLVIQIAKEAKTFDFTGSDIPTFWTNPLRLLIPYFPIINSPKKSFEHLFHDSPEAIGAGSPGWFLLILGTIGLWQNRKQITIFIPLLIILILCLLFFPSSLLSLKDLAKIILLIVVTSCLWLTPNQKGVFRSLFLVLFCILCIKSSAVSLPTLQIFPWFSFNRVGGRCTLIYPVILCIFALHINLNWLSLRRRQLLAGLLVILACLELGTAYSFRFNYQEPQPLEQNFFAYMNYVKQQPGEAVLDWPFCVLGGGITDALCPYRNDGIFALRRFHEKKVIGEYFGRFHSSQLEPYLQAGWNNLFLPDETHSRQRRCFKQAEWSFFTDFYKLNDFAGINLYVDRLPEDCVTEFYARFGSPAAETVVPGAGRVKFIPKSSEFRNQVNLAKGISLKFEPDESTLGKHE